MKKAIFISIVFLAVSIVGYSQTSKTLHDSITNRLSGNWYWVGTSGGLGGGGYGGPIENEYTTQIKLEKTDMDDSLQFSVYKNDVIQRTGKCYFTTDPTSLNTYRINNIMPDEHSDIMSPPEVDYDMQFQFMNKDSILFLNKGWADSFEYIYSRNPCKDYYKRHFVTQYNIWTVATESFDGQHYLPPVSEYLQFSIRKATVNDTVYMKLFSSTKFNWSELRLHSYWREDASGRIFRRYENHNEELVYDFSLTVGDTIKNKNKEKNAVVDSVLNKPFGSVEKKYLYAHLVIQPSHILTWIEGVGSMFGPNVNDDYFLTSGKSSLVCYEHGGELVYQNPKFNTCFYTALNDISEPAKGFKVYPNPVSRELFVQPNAPIDEPYTLELYSIKGELIRTECMEAGIKTVDLDVGNLKSGTYILRLISASGKYEENVIIKE